MLRKRRNISGGAGGLFFDAMGPMMKVTAIHTTRVKIFRTYEIETYVGSIITANDINTSVKSRQVVKCSIWSPPQLQRIATRKIIPTKNSLK